MDTANTACNNGTLITVVDASGWPSWYYEKFGYSDSSDGFTTTSGEINVGELLIERAEQARKRNDWPLIADLKTGVMMKSPFTIKESEEVKKEDKLKKNEKGEILRQIEF